MKEIFPSKVTNLMSRQQCQTVQDRMCSTKYEPQCQQGSEKKCDTVTETVNEQV